MYDLIKELIKTLKELTPKNYQAMLYPFLFTFVFAYVALYVTFDSFIALNTFFQIIVASAGTCVVMGFFYALYWFFIKLTGARYNKWLYNSIVFYSIFFSAIFFFVPEMLFGLSSAIHVQTEVSDEVKRFAFMVLCLAVPYLVVFITYTSIYLVFGKKMLKDLLNLRMPIEEEGN